MVSKPCHSSLAVARQPREPHAEGGIRASPIEAMELSININMSQPHSPELRLIALAGDVKFPSDFFFFVTWAIQNTPWYNTCSWADEWEIYLFLYFFRRVCLKWRFLLYSRFCFSSIGLGPAGPRAAVTGYDEGFLLYLNEEMVHVNLLWCASYTYLTAVGNGEDGRRGAGKMIHYKTGCYVNHAWSDMCDLDLTDR